MNSLRQNLDADEIAGAVGIWSAVAVVAGIWAANLSIEVSVIGVVGLAIGYTGRMLYANLE